jgi:hypothetical protein
MRALNQPRPEEDVIFTRFSWQSFNAIGGLRADWAAEKAVVKICAGLQDRFRSARAESFDIRRTISSESE